MAKHVVPQGTSDMTTPPKLAGWSRLARVLAVAVVAASLGACSSFDVFSKKDDTPPDEPADRLYNEGLYLLNAKKDARDAVKKFEEVDRQHPYSEWARKSLIMSAYAYYQAFLYDDLGQTCPMSPAPAAGSPDA